MGVRSSEEAGWQRVFNCEDRLFYAVQLNRTPMSKSLFRSKSLHRVASWSPPWWQPIWTTGGVELLYLLRRPYRLFIIVTAYIVDSSPRAKRSHSVDRKVTMTGLQTSINEDSINGEIARGIGVEDPLSLKGKKKGKPNSADMTFRSWLWQQAAQIEWSPRHPGLCCSSEYPT